MSVETEIVNISITQDTLALQRAGFGVPLLVSYDATFPEKVRYYSGLDGLVTDGFATDSITYRTANALLSQERRPDLFGVAHAINKPTLQYTISATTTTLSASDARSYVINVSGTGFVDAVASMTTDAAPSAEEINGALVVALNAVAGNNYIAAHAALTPASFVYTATNADEIFHKTAHGLKTGDGPFRLTTTGAQPAGALLATDYFIIKIDADTFFLATSLALALAGTHISITTDGTGTNTITSQAGAVRPADPFTVTADVAGGWFSLEVVNNAVLSCKLTHADPGIAADLDAIVIEDSNWYCLLTSFNSTAMVLATATWVEAQEPGKIYVLAVPETDAPNVNISTATDTITQLKTANFKRTAAMFHHRPATCAAACWAGDVLPLDPGSETWSLKRLTGVGISATRKLTTTQRLNLRAKNGNFVTVAFGFPTAFDGKTANGNFIDVVRGLDFVNDDMTKGIGGLLTTAKKVGMSNPGIAMILNQVEASLDRAVRKQIARKGTTKFSALTVEEIPDSEKAIRQLPDVLFEFALEGAIHTVLVKGRVTL